MIVVNGGATVVFNGWGYGQGGAWGYLDDNQAGRYVDAATLVYAGSGYTTTPSNRGNWTVGPDGATFDSEATGPGYWGWGVRTSGAFNSGWDNLNLQGTVTLTGSGNGDMQKALYGSGGIIKNGAGTWVLGYSQTNAGTHDDTYAGDTVINDGTLQIRATGLGAAIPYGASAGNVYVNSPGTLDLNSRSATVNGLSGNGAVTSSATGALTLTVGDNDQTSTFAGTIQNGLGVLALTKTGAGVLTLSGTNGYTGGTTVSGGTLVLANNEAIADGTSLTVGDPSAFLPAPVVPNSAVTVGSGLSDAAIAPVPEPGTLALLAAFGLWSAVACYRFSKRGKAR
jgi:autotransporter-associated beta strand protein